MSRNTGVLAAIIGEVTDLAAAVSWMAEQRTRRLARVREDEALVAALTGGADGA